MTLLLGQTDLNSAIWSTERKVIDIEKVLPHPKYDNVAAYYDIGLIFAAKDIDFTNSIQPIYLQRPTTTQFNCLQQFDREFALAGWGLSSPNKKSGEDFKLRYAPLTLFSNEKCDRFYDLHGKGEAAKERKKFLPNKTNDQTICAGSSVRSHITVNFRFKEVFRFKQEFHFPKMKKYTK